MGMDSPLDGYAIRQCIEWFPCFPATTDLPPLYDLLSSDRSYTASPYR
jgi:hypothetical protein